VRSLTTTAMPESNSHFDEKSGVVVCATPWGRWNQNVAEVNIEVDLEPGTRAKDLTVTIKPSQLSCSIKQKEIFNGKPFDVILEEESVWTVEDQKLLRIQLVKAFSKTKDKCWLSLLSSGQFAADPHVLNEMRKKLDLEQFQRENPGFDFSRAKLDKRYEDRSLDRMKKESEEFLNSTK